MLSIPLDRKTVEKKLKSYKPLNYNRFRWWRWYEEKNKPLPYKSNFKDKILNGDYNSSCYIFQAYLCEHMLNDLDKECGGDIAKFNEKGAMLKTRRKKLWEDYEKDEFNRLEALYKQFVKHFKIDKPQVIEECLECSGELIDLYYLIEDKYPKYNIISSKRGRPKNK
jgi:hypothetical protein